MSKKLRFAHALQVFGGTLLVCLAFGGIIAGCQTPTQEAKPVEVRPPPEVAERVEGARQGLIQALAEVAVDYDEAVCAADLGSGPYASARHALGEANLEVARALREADRISRARGGGPAPSSEGITMIEEPAQDEAPFGSWRCAQMSEQPACVDAGSNALAERIYRVYMAGYELKAEQISQALDAFAEDLRWAGGYLSRAPERSAALSSLEEACRAGDSPIARFFGEAERAENVESQRRIELLRDVFVGSHADICAALPDYYDTLVEELGNTLARRSRTHYCAVEPWAALP